MGRRYFAAAFGLAGLLGAACPRPAAAQQFPGGNAQALVAQNTYNGGTVSSQDSIFQASPANPTDPEGTLRAAVLAAETSVNLSAAFMHTQYHENATPGTGDDENGFTAGFKVGASGLLRDGALPGYTDIYTSLSYEFSAGNINYGGHYLFSGLPAFATDRAVFNRIEARVGVGFPLVHGMEVIPFLAAGYQSWNRNVENKGAIGTDEFYHSGLIGGGVKLDVPVTPFVVVSATAEMLALVGAGVTADSILGDGINVSEGFGPSAEERVSLGVDYDFHGPFHVISSLYWEHFNYSGSKPSIKTFYFYEPLSTTTQFGGDVGLAYSF